METDERGAPSIIRFGSFELDVRASELRKAGVRVKLQEQPYRVLLTLLEQTGRLVTREELRERLWPKNTFVDFDHSLNIAVAKIRTVLDDSATTPRFIETIPRRGYRFLAPVETVTANPDGAPPKRHGAIHSVRRRRLVWQLVPGGIAALLVVAVAAFTAVRAIRGDAGPYRIAVLPIQNLSPEPGADYFGDGLTDEIIHHLSLIDGLEVKSRTSSFAFKTMPRNMGEVGRELGVDLVLEGSVLRQGDRLRIGVRLVQVADDTARWSARYDRRLGDVLAIQDEISRSIVNELRLKNVGGQRRYNTDVKAYDLYLRAKALANEDAPGNAPRLRQAVELFEQVIVQQPDFAPAYAGLAEVYANLRNRGLSLESGRRLRQAAATAFELDPLLPEASASVGLALAADLVWPDAEQAFRRALQIAPSLSKVRQNFARYVLLPQGKVAEALEQVRRAADLDPLSASSKESMAFVFLAAGRYSEALETSTRVLAMNPGAPFAAQVQARALILEGKPHDAVATLERLGPPAHGYLGYAYAALGRHDEAKRLAAEDDPAAARHQVLIYTALGQRDRAFEALQTLAKLDDFMADVYPVLPELAPLQDDARMREFRRRRNLP